MTLNELALADAPMVFTATRSDGLPAPPMTIAVTNVRCAVRCADRVRDQAVSTLAGEHGEVIEAENPYQAAVVASAGQAGDVEITNVVAAVGRPPSTNGRRKSAKQQAAKKAPAKKKRQLSPETRAKLAKNLTKARAARAANRKAAAQKKQPIKKR